MSDKVMSNIRVLMKHDITVNWAKAVNFVPKAGEIIVYDDYFTYNGSGEKLPGIKIGDGTHTVNQLPFIDKRLIEHINDNSIHYPMSDISLDGKADLVDGKVPVSQLPSYVDDVIEGASLSALPASGESGKIYVTLDTNKTYRWSGSAYVEISASIVIGTTSTTAAAGNHTHTAAEVGAIAKPAEGTNGQVLTTDGAGNYTWKSFSAGDTKVTQESSTTDGALPALIAKSATNSTNTAYFSTKVKINPGTGEMNATQFALNGRKVIATETESGGWLWS